MSSLVTSQHAEELSTGARQLGVDLTPVQHELLLGYLALLIKWNKAYNLTAVRDPDEMVSRHLLDSLSVMPFIENGRWLDVGSGGGMPGIPLAILFPESQVTCLDSNGKKTRIYAATKFFIFTQASGLIMLVAILGLVLVNYNETGVLTFSYAEL